jgi:hypothetical protein
MTDLIAWLAFWLQLLSMILTSLVGGTEWRSLL